MKLTEEIKKLIKELNPKAEEANLTIAIKVYRAAEDRWEDLGVVSKGSFTLSAKVE